MNIVYRHKIKNRKKKFDSVKRDVMMEMLALYSIPEKLIGAIKVMLTKTRSRAITPGAEKDYLKIIAVALQGDTLAPFLYFLV